MLILLMSGCLISPTFAATKKTDKKEHKIVASKKEIQCLATNIYWESKSESREGKFAVAQVTYNRAKNDFYPKTICQVVYQKYKNVCQFSWVCHRPKQKIHKELWDESMDVARKVMLQGEKHAKLKNKDALFFHATYVNPYWSKKKVKIAKIGNHIFYSNRKTKAKPVLKPSNVMLAYNKR